MKKNLIALWCLWTVGCVAWSHFFGGAVNVNRFGETFRETAYWCVPVYVYLSGLVLLYVFTGINFVNEWERLAVLRFGRYVETAGPGLTFVDPLFHTIYETVSLQDTVIDVPVKDLQTKDNVGIAIDGLLTYCVVESGVKSSMVNVDGYEDSLLLRALASLTDEAGKTDLSHIMQERDAFCDNVKVSLSAKARDWGIEVKAFELKSLKISDTNIERAIAMKAEAQKEGEAQIVRANMQKQVAEALNKAAATYNEQGKWLKGLETILEMTRSAENNTVLLPTDLIGSLANIFPKA